MSNSNNESDPPDTSEPVSTLGRIEIACDRFEQAWHEGRPPRIEDFLELVPAVGRNLLLLELVRVDLECRWRLSSADPAGGNLSVNAETISQIADWLPKQPRLEDYLARYPALGTADEFPVEVIVQEYDTRRRWGDSPAHNEYFERFPGRRTQLADLLSRQDRELAAGKTSTFTGSQLESKERQVCCPECHTDFEVAGETSLTEITCRSCGHSFNLAGDATVDRSAPGGSTERPHETVGAGSSKSRSHTPASQRYRVLRPHAKGGLGQVSLAIDEELHREVAFKELLEHHAHSSNSRSRFIVEAEITGSLEHPGVVPVYGMGHYSDGRPYYAMRFIRGESMKKAIKRFHQGDTAGGDHGPKTLELRRLLGQFIDICNAVQYAHSRHVLHRDLKPDNVMLGKFGETLVVDWGLARLLSQSPQQQEAEELPLRLSSASGSAPTQLGSIIGTPGYMSPEQVEGRITDLGPASDVYSLGATLYSILTDQRPVTSRSIPEMIEKVTRGEFPRPRQIAPRVPRALEAICLKAMALGPDDRYPSASDLAEDVEHWLADEPVSAYQETLPERVGRWTRRHRAWTQAGAIALVLVAVVSVVAAMVVDAARKSEEIARGKAETLAGHNEILANDERAARQEARTRFADARNAVDTWLTGASYALQHYPGVQQIRRQLLEKAAEDFERFAEQRSDDAALETERGRAYLRLGDVQRLLGESADAENAYRLALSLFKRLSQSNPEMDDCRLELASSHVKLGLVLADVGNQDADQEYQVAIAELGGIAKAYPEKTRFRDSLGTALLNRAVLQVQAGARQEAEQTLRESIGHFEFLLQAESGERRYHSGLATALNILGQILTENGFYQDALVQLDKATAGFNTLVEDEPDNPEYLESLAATRIYSAGVLRRLGRYNQELDAYGEAVIDYQALTKALPDVPFFMENLALTRSDHGYLLHELGDTAKARTELTEASSVFERLATDVPQIPRYHEGQAACLALLGEVLSDLGRNEEAKSHCLAAVDIYQRLADVFSEEPQYRERLAVTTSHLGRVSHKLGDDDEALRLFQSAIEILDDLIESSPEIPGYRNELAFTWRHLGVLHWEAGDTLQAEKSLQQSLDLRQHLAATWDSPEYLNNLAKFLVECVAPGLRNPQRAIEAARRAWDKTPQNAFYCSTLGAACCRAADWQTAVEILHEAIRLRKEGSGRAWFFLGMAQWHLGESDEAEKSYNLACRWMATNRPDNPDLKRIRDEAAELLGKSDEVAPTTQ